MRVAIMQPYFLPYIGYYQLIRCADAFVVYDNIQYTKKGWINRNRILVNGTDTYLTVPLRSDSDFLDVRDRQVSPDFDDTSALNKVRGAYRRAPFFEQTLPLLSDVLTYPDRNLFAFLRHGLEATCAHLGIDTRIVTSSDVEADHTLTGQERVIDICHALGADEYVNPPGGRELYDHDEFAAAGLRLSFLEPQPFEYPQFGGQFVPWLSIVDVLMFNGSDRTREIVDEGYRLA